MKRKVAVLSDTTAPLGRGAGGMELSAADVLKGLARLDIFELTVLAHPGSSVPPGVSLQGCDIASCPETYQQLGDGLNKWLHAANDAALLLGSEQLPRDAVVVDMSSSVSAAMLAFTRGLRVVKVLRLHPCHPSNVLTSRTRHFTVYLTEHQFALDRWAGSGGRAVIPDSVALVKTRLRRSGNGAFVSIGRVERRKGHDLAAKIAQESGGRLRVIGEIVDKVYMRELVSVGGVEIMGPLSREAVLNEIADAHALIWTPRVPEPGGRVVVEALRSGIPVLAARAGYAADIADRMAIPTERKLGRFPVVKIDALPSWWPTEREVAEAYTEVITSL